MKPQTNSNLTRHRILKRPRIIWLILLLAAVCVCWQPTPQATLTAKIKVENDGAIMSGRGGAPAATAYGYDPYFIHENYTPNVVLPNVGQALKQNKFFKDEYFKHNAARQKTN